MKKEAFDLRENEELLVECKGDTWKYPGQMGTAQTSGRFYFTNQRIGFRTWGPLKGVVSFDIEYENIERIKEYAINFIIPTGIQVYLKNGDAYKISVMKRSEKINLMYQYMNN